MKLKNNDTVLVIAGKDKGKKSEILRLLKKTDKIVVKKVNIRTKHIKKTATRAGEKIQFEASISASNVMLVCPNCSKPTRVEYLITESGKKQRMCKKCKQPIDKKVESVKVKTPKKS